MRNFFNRRNKGIPPNATFRLTQEGREKLQEFNGDPRSRVLVALETGGTSSIEEISNQSQMSRGQVERMIPGLSGNGYIQYISPGMGSVEDE